MRVAAIYDIHGNLPALEAVLDDVGRAGVDRVVIGGDVLPGPLPGETLVRLEALDVPVEYLHGNGEVAALAHLAGEESPYNLPEQVQELVTWSAEQLSAEQRRAIASWPRTISLDVTGLGGVLFCHATPRHENEIFTRLTEESLLLPVFEGVEESLVVCGHTHMPFDRQVGEHRVGNAGSVGLPFGDPGAYWLLLGPSVDLRRVDYDFDDAEERILATSYPQAEQFVKDIMQPRSEQETLELFARAELR